MTAPRERPDSLEQAIPQAILGEPGQIVVCMAWPTSASLQVKPSTVLQLLGWAPTQ
jgi:hypothetical protein